MREKIQIKYINTMWSEQNGRNFADGNIKCILLNGNIEFR